MGAAGHAKEMPELSVVEQSARPLSEAKWDLDAAALDDERVEILELSGFDLDLDEDET